MTRHLPALTLLSLCLASAALADFRGGVICATGSPVKSLSELSQELNSKINGISSNTNFGRDGVYIEVRNQKGFAEQVLVKAPFKISNPTVIDTRDEKAVCVTVESLAK